MSDTTTYLYRLYDDAGQLLYVGISKSAIYRLEQHLSAKTWSAQIASTRIERHPDRPTALEAERTAILAEKPLHNIVHNGRTGRNSQPKSEWRPPDEVLSPGDYVALAMNDGECPVGVVEAVNDTWVRLGLKSFLSGYYGQTSRAYRLEQVREMVFAYVSDGEVDDEHLATFQTRWHQRHNREPLSSSQPTPSSWAPADLTPYLDKAGL